MILLRLLENLNPSQIVLTFSAHCDDVEIGCGGLLKRLQQDAHEVEVRGAVFTGGDDPMRRAEELSASKAFGIQHLDFFSYPDTLLPNHWHEIKQNILAIRNELGSNRIALVLCPRLDDRHQDHRVVAENVWRVFRDHLIVEYEIHKYEGDLGHPNLYVHLSEAQAREKCDLLLKHYPSRACHHWWKDETFLGLMKLRGVEANASYAEGLYARKILL